MSFIEEYKQTLKEGIKKPEKRCYGLVILLIILLLPLLLLLLRLVADYQHKKDVTDIREAYNKGISLTIEDMKWIRSDLCFKYEN